MERYERTQHTMWMWGIALLVVIIEWLVGRANPFAPWLFMSSVGALIVVVTWVFSQLNIRVDDSAVRWHFGLEAIGGEIPLSQIASVEVTQTNLLEGFGIHWTIWHGWLWNVAGFSAVEITKLDGGRVTLGTDDPEGLYDAIVARRRGL